MQLSKVNFIGIILECIPVIVIFFFFREKDSSHVIRLPDVEVSKVFI